MTINTISAYGSFSSPTARYWDDQKACQRVPYLLSANEANMSGSLIMSINKRNVINRNKLIYIIKLCFCPWWATHKRYQKRRGVNTIIKYRHHQSNNCAIIFIECHFVPRYEISPLSRPRIYYQTSWTRQRVRAFYVINWNVVKQKAKRISSYG